MIAKDLVSTSIQPLCLSDTVSSAVNKMGKFQLRNLPVVENNRYLGLLNEEDLILNYKPELTLQSFDITAFKPYSSIDSHILSLVKKVNDLHISALPIIDLNQNYAGVITTETLLNYFSQLHAVQEPGGIIVIEVRDRDYSLVNIAQIIENNNAKILNMYMTTYPKSHFLDITIKINHSNLSDILNDFERYEYTVKGFYEGEHFVENLQEHYDSLINYLNI